MGLSKYIAAIGGLLLLFSSCSKKIAPGFYVTSEPHNLLLDRDKVYGYLKLDDDSSFVYEDVVDQFEAEDVGDTHLGYVGMGRYKLLKNAIVLTFDEKFKFKNKDSLDQRFIENSNAIIVSYFGEPSEWAHSNHEAKSPRVILLRNLTGPLKGNESNKALRKIKFKP